MSDWKKDLTEELKDPEFAKLYGAAHAKTSFALTLFKARQIAKITQEELAKKMGISQPYVAKLESGEANPTLGTVGSLLAVLGLGLVTSTEPLVPEPSSPPGVMRSVSYAVLRVDANAISVAPTTELVSRRLEPDIYLMWSGTQQDNPIDATVPIWSRQREPVAGGTA